ncbi:MAG: flagellar hook-basal body complex protein [Planctomycetaceae bacterium]|nr:flagellar hook-basal body complex protein [Planctomycetaceae bacterium]
MPSALFAALSGLQAHENWISVIGNNLSNANTPGYKSARAVFSDQFSQTLRYASLPSGSLGGRNPMQLGLGVQLSDIGRDFNQGALASTGRTFDLALNGRGHFMVSDGANTLYTRVGTFGLDATSRLVDQRTGFRVLGLNGQPINLDTTSLFPPTQTSQISFAGNLPATITGPLSQVLTASTALKQGTSATLSGSVNTNSFTVPVGQTWTMEVIVDGGAPQTVSLAGQAAPYTALDIANAINAQTTGVTAVDNGGAVQISTDRTGQARTLKVVSGVSGQDLASLTGLSLSQVSGTESTATLSTALNDLPTNLVDYQPGDVIEIAGVDTDGTSVLASFVYGAGNDGTTVSDLLNFIDNAFPNATPSFDATTGQFSIRADQTGATGLSLTLSDQSGAGSTDWPQHSLITTTAGAGPDKTTTSIEVFDSAGTSHTVSLTFERQDDGSWNVIPSSADGTVSGLVTGLRFNANGSIASLPATSSFSVQFPGQSAQSVSVDFGTPGLFDGVTQFGQGASVFADFQDGYGVGELSNMAVNSDGDIQGFYTNGQIQVLGELGIASFVNDNGLREVGDNLWAETPNSGVRTVSKGAQGKAGQVNGGALEGSNVSVAEEFVRLIEAQRGFQANARVITTTNEVLAELVNLV